MYIILIWVGVLLAALTVYFRRLYSSFEKGGVKHFKPLPLLGNMGGLMLRKRHFTADILNLYRAYPEERFVGSYEFMSPVVLIRDLELVKKIAVKDFEFFLDHRNKFEGSDSFWTKSLIFMKGQEWKDMRSTLSPAFTSSKIRLMVPFMVEVGDQMIIDLKQKIGSADGYIDVDCKDLASSYATDVIASCAFGFKVNTFSEKDNEFYTMGKEITGFNFSKLMRVLIISNLPIITKITNIDFMSQESIKFFKTLILDAINDRTLHHIVRPDMVHLLMEARNGKLTHDSVITDDKTTGFASVEESSIGTKKVNRKWDDSELVAQAVLFFIAGFDTVSTTMSFLLYELAINPDVQEKLAQEIKENDLKNDGKFDYKSIQSMTYLDMVVSETLRMWPPGPALERLCNTDYNLGKPNKNSTQDFIIRKGTAVIIPAHAFHRNPEYFPNPDKFDPERFSTENQHKIQPHTYLPFGVGPRNCIGSRFALCEVKVMTYQILRHVEVSPCEKTCIPAELDPKSFSMKLKGGHWLRFKTRTEY